MEWNAKGWIFARIFSVLLSFLLETFCCHGGLALPYRSAFLLPFLSQWLTILTTSQMGPREDEVPNGRRPKHLWCRSKENGPLQKPQLWGRAPFLHTWVQKECPVSKDCATSGVPSTRLHLGSLLLSFGGGGLNKAVKEKTVLNSGPDKGTAGTLVGVDTCRQLGANSQPEKIPQDF